jgi:hypothetical protein
MAESFREGSKPSRSTLERPNYLPVHLPTSLGQPGTFLGADGRTPWIT